jgi:hypothetical protein
MSQCVVEIGRSAVHGDMRMFLPVLFGLALAAPTARAEDDRPLPAWRVGTGTIRVALLPVRCTRDMAKELCSALDQSLGVELARDPRLDVVSPHDLEVLVGAQELSALQSCDGDNCFDSGAFQQIGAAYTVAVVVGRIGNDALVTARLVDMRRGTVLDRDDARVTRANEDAIDQATRDLVQALLARRGIGTPLAMTTEERGPSGLFIAGALISGLGGAGVIGGGALGGLAAFEAATLEQASAVSRTDFDASANAARGLALGADVALGAGGILVVTGVALMIAGSL